jgi:hypothetical protein
MRIATILTLIILFTNLGLNGQTRTIIGRVISEYLEPFPMVYIQNSDKLLLGKTDMDGRFIISIPQETERLLFGTVGMEWAEIKLKKDCDTVEVVMMYDGTYDFMSSKKIDRDRKKRFDKLSIVHSEALRNGLFKNNYICYNREFKPEKPSLDSISRVLKLKREQIKDTYKALMVGDTIRIPYSGEWRYDGTDRTTLHFYSYVVDGENFKCIIKGIITGKNKRKGGYNISYRVIDCKDCHFDDIVFNGKELKVGELIEYNMRYFKIIKNK